MFVCTNPRYTPITDTFASVEEFQAMCFACFGERAKVCRRVDGRYYDETGAIVLSPTCDYWSALFGELDAVAVVREYDLRVGGRELEEWLDVNESMARLARIEIPATGRDEAFAALEAAIMGVDR
jgi:hypothetical protein